VWSAIGREFTLATNQVDFAIPSKFNLTYVDKNDKENTPLCIHRAPLGTHERFIGFLIEHFAGDFPLWLSPSQVMLIPISEKFNDYANSVNSKLRENGIRSKIDLRNEKMGAKIRNAEVNKIPIMAIVGEQEVNNNSISIRRRFKGDQGSIDVNEFIKLALDEIENRKKLNSDS
jgi:threonyl-tRNA synthetase